MATWGIYIGVGVVIFLVLARIPGFSILMMPIAMAIGGVVSAVTASVLSWTTYILKVVIRAHTDFLGHLFNSEEHFDVELEIKRREGR